LRNNSNTEQKTKLALSLTKGTTNKEQRTKNKEQKTKNKKQRTKNNKTSQFPTYRELESALPGKLPVAERITEQVICLPLYPELPQHTIEFISSLLK